MRTMTTAAISDKPSTSMLLQRKCDCGSAAQKDDEQCPACQMKSLQTKLQVGSVNDPLEKEADNVAAQVMSGGVATRISDIDERLQSKSDNCCDATVSSDVTQQIMAGNNAGRALENSDRTLFESRFARDFSHVRIHDDSSADNMTRQLRARAFTVGSHIYLSQAETQRNGADKQYLLAHELTHVVQQTGPSYNKTVNPGASGLVQRIPFGESSAMDRYRFGQPLPYREATNMADCLRIMGPDSQAYCEREVLGQATPETEYAECMRQRGPDPTLCDPDRALGWNDFQAAAPAGGTHTAMTFSEIIPRQINSGACADLAYGTSGAQSRGFQAHFDPARSWVKPGFGTDASQNNANGCDALITSCENDINATPNSWWEMNTGANAQCPASATPRGDRANNVGECTTVVGVDCNDRAVAESLRLLQHEQGHFDITCVIAGKAQDALNRGGDFDNLLPVARQKLQQTQNSYDSQTNHGCNAAQQSTWETNIANNLPAVQVP